MRKKLLPFVVAPVLAAALVVPYLGSPAPTQAAGCREFGEFVAGVV